MLFREVLKSLLKLTRNPLEGPSSMETLKHSPYPKNFRVRDKP
jgi:hypothetical protein